MSTVTPEAMAETSIEYPRRWVWTEADQGSDEKRLDYVDGLLADGHFVRFDKGRTENGPKVIAILEIAGEERSVWLNHEALHNRFQDELLERPDHEIKPGERIVVEQLSERKQSKNNRTYVGYRVFFPDAPELNQMGLFESVKPSQERTPSENGSRESTSAPSENGTDDDGIPF